MYSVCIILHQPLRTPYPYQEDGATHRRGGVHTETPGKILSEGARDSSLPDDVGGEWETQVGGIPTIEWGRGNYDETLGAYYTYQGGLYMASNVANSTRVWNCKIERPEEVVGPLGDLEHLR